MIKVATHHKTPGRSNYAAALGGIEVYRYSKIILKDNASVRTQVLTDKGYLNGNETLQATVGFGVDVLLGVRRGAAPLSLLNWLGRSKNSARDPHVSPDIQSRRP